MTQEAVSTFKDKIEVMRFDPVGMNRAVYDLLGELSNGEEVVVDPTNPFAFLMDASLVATSSAMFEAESLTRKLYPSMALTEKELYLHMSDKDYLGRFSSPSSTVFTILISKEELKAKVIPTDLEGVSKLVIPRNTEFMVAGLKFTMEYPIEVRTLSHGAIQVVYDTDRPSPLKTIENNMVDWSVIKLDSRDYISINVPIQQLTVVSKVAQLSLSATYSKTFNFEDDYYYCRVYKKLSNGTLSEIITTHTDQVFDALRPTVLLEVTDGQLNVTIPQVYVLNKSLEGDIRIDIYTTQGAVDVRLDGYELDSFTASWRDLDYVKGLSKYSAPISTFSDMAVYSDKVVSGGSDKLSFATLRERVINNALGGNNNPITKAQINSVIDGRGYKLITDIDNVTSRVFKASKNIPVASSNEVSSGIGCIFGNLQESFDELVLRNGVIDNGERITITNKLLYTQENEVITIVPDNVVDEVNSLTGELLLNRVNESSFLHSPFYCVLDSSKNYLDSRFYLLDNPNVEAREFIKENSSLPLYISTNSYEFTKTELGYKLLVQSISGDIIKTLPYTDITCQLSFKPVGENKLVYLNGSYAGEVDGELVFEFDILSRHDIDDNDDLYLSGFNMFAGEDRSYPTNLTSMFNLVYYVKDFTLASGAGFSELPIKRAGFLLPGDYKGISHETVTLNFGYSMEGLWNSARTLLTGVEYEKYTSDVMSYYEENQYERDPVTGAIKLSINALGEVVYTLLHSAGDPVLDVNGVHLVKHYSGTSKLNGQGELTPINVRKLLREFTLFLVDGSYLFVDNESDKKDFSDLPNMIKDWLDNDIKEFSNWALEQTDFFLQPSKSIGGGKVSIYDGEIRTLSLQQSFVVTYYLTANGYEDMYLRDTLTTLTRTILADELKGRVITMNSVISKITTKVGDEIISVDITGLGGDLNLPAMTMMGEDDSCTLKKKVVKDIDGSRKITDDIEIVFVRHVVT